MITPKDCKYNTTIDLDDGRQIKIAYQSDDLGLPWVENDGHGPVREVPASRYARPAKAPGERLMFNRHHDAWAYDIAGAMRQAKAEGWGLTEEDTAKLAAKLGHKPSDAEIRAEAVERDFDYCDGYLREQWEWICVRVTLLDPDGEEIAGDSLGGMESLGDYASEEAAGMANALIEADDKETAERAFWLSREVLTV